MRFHPLITIPLYNHAATAGKIASEAASLHKNVLIVDDGSTDGGFDKVKDLPVNIIRFQKNKGKGSAIIAAASWAKNNGFSHIVTIDADGQHFPSDIEKLLSAAKEQSSSIIIGKRNFDSETIPKASKFGRKFSGFWAKVQTGKTIVDIQSGFRVYPVEIFDKYKIFTRRFTFEVEIIIKAVWAGFDVKETEIGVHYPKNRAERVSHFSFIKDNARLGVLNTYLTLRSMLPIAHRKFIKDDKGDLVSINPFKVVAEQLKSDNNPLHLGISAAWGSLLGALALPGIRSIFLIIGAGWFNLNRAVVFSVDKLAMPPFIPFVCIEVGYFLRHGKFLTEISWQIVGTQFLQRVWEWILGSLIVAPIFALIVGSIVFTIGQIMKFGAKKYL